MTGLILLSGAMTPSLVHSQLSTKSQAFAHLLLNHCDVGVVQILLQLAVSSSNTQHANACRICNNTNYSFSVFFKLFHHTQNAQDARGAGGLQVEVNDVRSDTLIQPLDLLICMNK